MNVKILIAIRNYFININILIEVCRDVFSFLVIYYLSKRLYQKFLLGSKLRLCFDHLGKVFPEFKSFGGGLYDIGKILFI